MRRLFALLLLLSAGASQAAAQGVGDPATVVAKVDGQAITRAELDARVAKELAKRGRKPSDIPAEQRAALDWQVLDFMISEKIMRGAVVDAKVSPDPARVDQAIGQLKQRAGSEEAFAQMLSRQGMTEIDLRDEMLFNSSLDQLLRQRFAAQLALDPSAALQYYNEHPDFWKREESVRARHVLVLVDKDATDAVRAEKKKEIDAALARVQGGEDFGAVAQAVSQDPGTKARGGELPAFTRGQMVPEFEKLAFSLQAGQMSPVFATQYGYHFLQVLGVDPARTLAFDEVKARIEQLLEGRKRQELGGQMVNQLREAAKVEIFLPKPPEPMVPAPSPAPAAPKR